MHYDHTGDRLYLPIEPEYPPAYSDQVSEHVWVRRAIDDNRIVGLEVERLSTEIRRSMRVPWWMRFLLWLG